MSDENIRQRILNCMMNADYPNSETFYDKYRKSEKPCGCESKAVPWAMQRYCKKCGIWWRH